MCLLLLFFDLCCFATPGCNPEPAMDVDCSQSMLPQHQPVTEHFHASSTSSCVPQLGLRHPCTPTTATQQNMPWQEAERLCTSAPLIAGPLTPRAPNTPLSNQQQCAPSTPLTANSSTQRAKHPTHSSQQHATRRRSLIWITRAGLASVPATQHVHSPCQGWRQQIRIRQNPSPSWTVSAQHPAG